MLMMLTACATVLLNIALRMAENEFLATLRNCIAKCCCSCRKRETKLELSPVICKAGHVLHLFRDCRVLTDIEEERKKHWPLCQKCRDHHKDWIEEQAMRRMEEC